MNVVLRITKKLIAFTANLHEANALNRPPVREFELQLRRPWRPVEEPVGHRSRGHQPTLDKVGVIVWLAERHLREVEGPSLPEVVRTSRAHSDHLIEELRAIGNWTEHTPGAPEEHIHEPSTGGVGPCGPCRAWRVLNGSTGALR